MINSISLSATTAPILAWALLTALVAVPPLGAQTTQVSPPGSTGVVVLEPFDVNATNTRRYVAPNSISGTAMNALLKELPMTINVVTSDFLEDSLVGSFERALDYNSSIVQTTRSENSNRVGLMSIRGFRNRNLLLDGVLASDFLPTQLIERIEVVERSQHALRAIGSGRIGERNQQTAAGPKRREHIDEVRLL